MLATLMSLLLLSRSSTLAWPTTLHSPRNVSVTTQDIALSQAPVNGSNGGIIPSDTSANSSTVVEAESPSWNINVDTAPVTPPTTIINRPEVDDMMDGVDQGINGVGFNLANPGVSGIGENNTAGNYNGNNNSLANNNDISISCGPCPARGLIPSKTTPTTDENAFMDDGELSADDAIPTNGTGIVGDSLVALAGETIQHGIVNIVVHCPPCPS